MYLERSIFCIIALLINNAGFGPGFSYSDWQNSSRDQSNLEPDWLTGPKIRIVGLSFADIEMDETVYISIL